MRSFYNGQFLDESQLKLPVQDLSIQRGYGLFEFFRTENFVPVFLNDHLDRLYGSARALFLDLPYPRNELKEIIDALIRMNNIPRSGIRINLTGGISTDGYNRGVPEFFITQRLLDIPRKLNTSPYALISYPYQRPLAHVKSID